ncbi:hypothetical protein [Pseudonocardia sp.]|uniref:hypothetical protein n=1 Tax=Pseudonocardia sp. TaxID=60912 RepID=UPI00260F71A8|nr:hypothetical protein [Pseudonocardia sp.]
MSRLLLHDLLQVGCAVAEPAEVGRSGDLGVPPGLALRVDLDAQLFDGVAQGRLPLGRGPDEVAEDAGEPPQRVVGLCRRARP